MSHFGIGYPLITYFAYDPSPESGIVYLFIELGHDITFSSQYVFSKLSFSFLIFIDGGHYHGSQPAGNRF